MVSGRFARILLWHWSLTKWTTGQCETRHCGQWLSRVQFGINQVGRFEASRTHSFIKEDDFCDGLRLTFEPVML